MEAFFEKGFGYTCSCVVSLDGDVSTDGWVVGWDPTRHIPIFMHEFAVLHGVFLP